MNERGELKCLTDDLMPLYVNIQDNDDIIAVVTPTQLYVSFAAEIK